MEEEALPSGSKGSTRKRRKMEEGKGGKLSSHLLIDKVIHHSRAPSSPAFLRYLQGLRRAFSSSDFKLWTEFRQKGGLKCVQKVVEEGAVEGVVVSLSLSIIGNSYSLDYCARKEAASNGFIKVLHRLVQPIGLSKSKDLVKVNVREGVGASPEEEKETGKLCQELEVKARAVKCVGNLSRDTGCREVLLRAGVGVTILKLLGDCNALRQEVAEKEEEKDQEVELEGEDQREGLTELEECVKACVRSLRILSSESSSVWDEEARMHLIRFKAVFLVGEVLSWTKCEDLKLDVVRSLANLTDKVRLLPNDQVDELTNEEGNNKLLKEIIAMFQQCAPDSKLFCPVIRCLNNFAMTSRIAEMMGTLRIITVALQKLRDTSEKSTTEICRLLVTLTKQAAVNKCLLYNCQEIWSTLNILKCDRLEEHHRWILHVYENVYEGSLNSLVQNGLVGLIYEHFKKELEDCDYEVLKNKILSLDENACSVHQNICPFMPRYRCNSPSYHRVQEETQILLRSKTSNEGDSGSSGIDSSSSPSSSPARSWTSDDSMTDCIFRPSSPASSSSSLSEDEGCYSPIDSSLSLSPTYSEGSPEHSEESELYINFQRKRPRLSSCHIPFGDCAASQSSSKSPEVLRNNSKKIVMMLNILQKITFLEQMPSSLVQLAPILLSFLVRGIASLTPQRFLYQDEPNDVEMTKLGRRSFTLAYKILKAMCLNVSFFPSLIGAGTVAIISRLVPWDSVLTRIGNNERMSVLLDTLRGSINNTSGYREGQLMRTLLVSKSNEELTTASVVIPLLFRKNDHILRNFEAKGSSWTRLFDLLAQNQDVTSSLFQDCILSISTLCGTIGMNFDNSAYTTKPQLLKIQEKLKSVSAPVFRFLDEDEPEMDTDEAEAAEPNSKVKICLDDGTLAVVSKSLLTDSSPVFSAMFDGHFKEAGSQEVRIPNISKQSLRNLLEQLYFLRGSLDEGVTVSTSKASEDDASTTMLDLPVIFEMLSLADQFLIEPIYERTLNTLLCNYICPYSAPEIYLEAMKLSALLKPQNRQQDMDVTFIVLKYLLVGDLSMTKRCFAFRKIFDIAPPPTVVGDIRALVEFYSTRPHQVR